MIYIMDLTSLLQYGAVGCAMVHAETRLYNSDMIKKCGTSSKDSGGERTRKTYFFIPGFFRHITRVPGWTGNSAV